MPLPPVAAIDLGTNTARLLIGYREEDSHFRPVLVKRHITRLGGGFSKTTGIAADARERTVAALLDFAAEVRRHGVRRVRAVATSAVRDAVNGRDFCAEILARTGIRAASTSRSPSYARPRMLCEPSWQQMWIIL